MNAVCHCCTSPAPPAPLVVENRPGLSAIAYRIGTYAGFREALVEALARTPELATLTTRSGDDYAVTVLELWSAVADVLTFYQERYANEAFLRTATRRESVVWLARLLGYRPRPGVAAFAHLAFTLDEGRAVVLPAGLRVQSVPASDERPQNFETLEAIAADARLNRVPLLPVPGPRNPFACGPAEALLTPGQGALDAAAALAPGDRFLLFKTGAAGAVAELVVRELRVEGERVVLGWTGAPQGSGWDASSAASKLARSFRLFGHNAPAQYVQAATASNVPGGVRWTVATTDYAYPGGTATSTTTLDLDGRYDKLAAGVDLLVVDAGGAVTRVTVQTVVQAQVAFAGASDTVTRLTVSPAAPATTNRGQVVIYELAGPPIRFWGYAYPERITPPAFCVAARKIDADTVEIGRTILRNEFRPGAILNLSEIAVGRTVMLADATGPSLLGRVGSVPTLTPPDAGGFCHLVLDVRVEGPRALETASAALLGNVAAASHGETVAEVVGSGDAGATFQRLALKKKPLTYVPAAGPEGARSTLELLVNRVRWTEVPSLFGQPPTAQVFVARTAEDGGTVLQFGDGREGATLPTGENNVTASYRVGAGLAGRVRAGSLTTLLQRPLGLSAATNPLPAEGGADPEAADAARRNAPRTVRTFGRAVSLRDFEDLITASGEVVKAQATWVWDGLERAIYLTVAGQVGGTFGAQALRRLAAGLAPARDPNHPLRLDNYAGVPVCARAALTVEPAFVQADVVAAARGALLAALAFDALALGEPVHLSDVVRVLQEVPGVVAVDVDELGFRQPAGMSGAQFQAYLDRRGVARLAGGTVAPVQPRLRIFAAQPDPARRGAVTPAELARVEAPAQDIVITATGGLTA